MNDLFLCDLCALCGQKLMILPQRAQRAQSQGAVFIIDFDGVLLLDFESGLPQSMCQRVLIHLFQVPMAMVGVNVIGSLSHEIAMRLYVWLNRVHDAIPTLTAANAKNFLSY
jgi:hypothetical protein